MINDFDRRNNLLVDFLLEYMLNTLERAHNDVIDIRQRFNYSDVFTDDYYALMINSVRYDCLSCEFRKIKNIIQDFR